ESFIENDHLYKVKPGTTEVSLESNYDGYLYGGSVIISSTVVHDGVTYSVTEINSFYNYHKASTITLEEGIQRINNNSLYALDAEYLYLPASLVFFPANAEGLQKSPNMLAVYVSSDNPYYYTYDQCLYRRDSLIAVPQGIAGSVTVKDGTRTIPRWIFKESKCCAVNIPASVRFVGSTFMKDCKNIADIYVHWSAEELKSIVFEQSQFPYNVKDYYFNGLIYSNITIHVPQGTVDTYKAHQVWGLIPNITDN
ncbi:MAG: leucine-rich repeat protein, partial [Bacteroidales bacterium]|nr:leucine-rich repeat protein [Bacteroidales bacterium]